MCPISFVSKVAGSHEINVNRSLFCHCIIIRIVIIIVIIMIILILVLVQYVYMYRHGSELTEEEVAELKERQDKLCNQCAQLEQRYVHLCDVYKRREGEGERGGVREEEDKRKRTLSSPL